MPKLRLYCEGKLHEELEIEEINENLNEILKDVKGFSSPGNTPSIEHPKDSEIGYLKAGSEVFVPTSYSDSYMDTNPSESYVTYTFQVAWDENISQHDTDKHWNLKIFRSIHFRDGRPKKDYYDISGFKNLNHLKCKKIKIELLDDSGKTLVSREFIKEDDSKQDEQ